MKKETKDVSAFVRTYDLILWIIPTLDKFPRRQKFLLADRIQTTLLDILGWITKAMLGFVPQSNLQVIVINQHPNYSMVCLLVNPIFYERIKDNGGIQATDQATDQAGDQAGDQADPLMWGMGSVLNKEMDRNEMAPLLKKRAAKTTKQNETARKKTKQEKASFISFMEWGRISLIYPCSKQ